MNKQILTSILVLFFVLIGHGKSKVDLAKTNGIKVVLDNNESDYNTYIKEAMEAFWDFSSFTFITQNEYQEYTGKEEDFVLSMMAITVTMEYNFVWCENAHFITLTNDHKHIPKKNNRIDVSDLITYDFIPENMLAGEDLKALIHSTIREQNSYVKALYEGSKSKNQAVSYKTLKAKIAKHKSVPVYILEKDLVVSKDYLKKIGNTTVKVVDQATINQALITRQDVLIYRYQDFNQGHSIKKLVHAKTGEVLFNMTNGKTNNKATLKDVLKRIS